jgi:hypothetical protein
MVKRSSNGQGDAELLRLYDQLDRFEELIEDMAELGVNSTEEAERKIIELNERIDAIEDAGNDH